MLKVDYCRFENIPTCLCSNENSTLKILHSSHPANIGPQDVPRTSPSNVPRTSLKILFDRPGDVLKWRPGDVLIWRSRDVPGRLIRDVPRTFSGLPLKDLPSAQTWMFQHFFKLFFQTYSIDQIYLKAFQYSRCIENPVKLLRWSMFCKIS